MRQHRFVRPCGPSGPYADGYREYLVARGYSFGALGVSLPLGGLGGG